MTISEQIDSLLSKQKEIDYILVTETIKEYLVTWPLNVDSQLWNNRLESLLKRIDEKFSRTTNE
jgi:archaellum biogenesis ATPase FlaH